MRWSYVIPALLLAGCAWKHAPTPIAMPTPAPEPEKVVVASLQPPAQTETDWLPSREPLPDVKASDARRSVEQANRQAIIRPRRSDFTKSVVVYPDCQGCVYEVTVGFQVITDLVFPPQEHVLKVKGDDWFEVEQKTLGEPSQYHVLVLSKLSQQEFPEIAKRTFRLTIVTNQRTLYLLLNTQDDARYAMTAVTWKPREKPKKSTTASIPGPLHGGYSLCYGDCISQHTPIPAWLPTGVGDTDVHGQTVIQLPPAWKAHDAPLLYIIGPDQEKRVTNYRPVGNSLIVDRLFTEAELRVGHDASAAVVRIVKGPQHQAVPTSATAGVR
jgi:type IV secretion system protein VirB9